MAAYVHYSVQPVQHIEVAVEIHIVLLVVVPIALVAENRAEFLIVEDFCIEMPVVVPIVLVEGMIVVDIHVSFLIAVDILFDSMLSVPEIVADAVRVIGYKVSVLEMVAEVALSVRSRHIFLSTNTESKGIYSVQLL